MNTTPSDPNKRDPEGVFEWLAHERGPDTEANHDAPPTHDRAQDRAHDRVPTVHPHVRLDPLTVQGVVNRVLVFVLCLVAIAVAFETVGALTSSRAPRSTNVTPAPVPTTSRPGTSAPHRNTSPAVADHPTPTTTAPVALATVPVTSAPVTTPPRTAPRQTTPRQTSPRQTSPRATFSPPVVQSSPPPQTAPPQTIQVPSTPTTHAISPSDSVAVPFK
jgi:hypothetical protein